LKSAGKARRKFCSRYGNFAVNISLRQADGFLSRPIFKNWRLREQRREDEEQNESEKRKAYEFKNFLH
jgi:hypothetical protein